jgi:hypothetical protein
LKRHLQLHLIFLLELLPSCFYYFERKKIDVLFFLDEKIKGKK